VRRPVAEGPDGVIALDLFMHGVVWPEFNMRFVGK